MTPLRLAVFDFDGTVCAGNSLHLLMRHLAFRRWLLLRIAAISLRRKLRWLNSREFKDAVLSLLRGQTEAELVALGETIYREEIRPRLRPAAIASIAAARAEGARVILLTGAFDFVIGPFQREHCFDAVICCRTERAGGAVTGRIAGAENLGPEKPAALRATLGTATEIDWSNSSTYTDDLRDLPLLELFGHRFLVGAPEGTPLPAGVVRLHWADPVRR